MSEALTTLPDAAVLKVLDGIEMSGSVNTGDAQIAVNIAHSIRLGYPQIRPQVAQLERVCLVGSGPSLLDTFDELRELYFQGAKLVTVNGSYQWCLERNLRPSAQIVLDARPENARFLEPAIPQCRYVLASQCASESWAAVEGRPDVWIWHAVGDETSHRALLDGYYGTAWHGVAGGTTVISRALSLLRTIGFLRFDLFGVDSCWMGTAHHAFPQVENEKDRRIAFRVHPTGHPEQVRVFHCAPWHVQALEDFLQMVRVNGQHFLLNVHGDGLLAYALRSACEVSLIEAAAEGAVQREER